MSELEHARTAILVEGASDRAALEALLEQQWGGPLLGPDKLATWAVDPLTGSGQAQVETEEHA